MATLALTSCLASGEKQVDGIMDKMIVDYNRFTGSNIDRITLLIGMLKRKCDNYRYHRRLFLQGHTLVEVMRRQVLQLIELLVRYEN